MTGTSLIATMAERYHMEPVQFARTVRKTVMPSQHTDEEFAAYMMVAYEYGLNPITREIFAYPKKGGGITPVVSIDGWIHLINAQPMCDGIEISYVEDPTSSPTNKKPPVSATCTIWRKDRGHPTVITEYYSECVRGTEPWSQMPRRMLRHKAVKECGRLAFGFGGISDEDEARDIAGAVQQIQKPIILDGQVLDDLAASADPSTGSASPSAPTDEPGEPAGATPSAPADPRTDAIFKLLDITTDKRLSLDNKLEELDGKQPVWADQLPADFVKELIKTGIKIAKEEQTPAAAKRYLENLP